MWSSKLLKCNVHAKIYFDMQPTLTRFISLFQLKKRKKLEDSDILIESLPEEKKTKIELVDSDV